MQYLTKLDSEQYFGSVDVTVETALPNRGEWGLNLHDQCQMPSEY